MLRAFHFLYIQAKIEALDPSFCIKAFPVSVMFPQVFYFKGSDPMNTLFAIKVSMVNFGESMPVEKRTTLVTGKGQVYFVNKLLAEKEQEKIA